MHVIALSVAPIAVMWNSKAIDKIGNIGSLTPANINTAESLPWSHVVIDKITATDSGGGYVSRNLISYECYEFKKTSPYTRISGVDLT